MKITIIGGAGGMGKWFAGFFKANGAEVRIVDKSEQTEAVARQIGVEFLKTDILGDEKEEKKEEGEKEIAATEVLLVSVPIDLTSRVIERVGPRMPAGSLLMDLTSVKKAPVAAMERFASSGVEILGTHPLFGPSAKSLQGQTVILVPSTSRSGSSGLVGLKGLRGSRGSRGLRGLRGSKSEKIAELFKSNGARIEVLTAAEHDEIMAVVQGLTHFILIAFGVALKDLDFEVARARRFMNPQFKIITDFVGRLLHQDPHLYATIQTNFEMGGIHEAFLTTASRLHELVLEGRVGELVKEMQEAKRHFGNAETERAFADSERVLEQKLKEGGKRKK